MRRSEALVTVAYLEAAYPHAKITDETRQLYATRLEPYDAQVAEVAAKELVDEWRDWRFPGWAHFAAVLLAVKSRQPSPPALAVPTTDPPPEAIEAMKELAASVSRRSKVMGMNPPATSPSRPLGTVRVLDGTLIIESRNGSVIWDYQPTGSDARDEVEYAHAARIYGVPIRDLRRGGRRCPVGRAA